MKKHGDFQKKLKKELQSVLKQINKAEAELQQMEGYASRLTELIDEAEEKENSEAS